MFTAYITFFAGLAALFLAEQCRRSRKALVDKFMTESGGPFSLFALPYLGRPQAARQAIEQSPLLRKLRLIELYLQALALTIAGLWLIWQG
jgi:hypothetical protein